MIKVSLRKPVAKPSADQTLVVFVSAVDKQKKFALPKLEKDVAALLDGVAQDELFSGKTKESLFFRQVGRGGYQNVLFVGVGSAKGLTAENARTVAAYTLGALKNHKVRQASVNLDSLVKQGKNAGELLAGFTEGLNLSSYEFLDYKSKKKDDPAPKITEIALEVSGLNKGMEQAYERATILAAETNFARTLGDASGNRLTPTMLADAVQARAKKLKGLKVTVWDKNKIIKENFGGLWGVSQGSVEEPRFIIMEYNGAPKSKKPIYFVGKGVTFDSGGISIKPSAAMDEMKHDMCGAAAVIGMMMALVELKAKVNVVALVPATENMPSGTATKPGDILVHRNGKTTEVLNTDAEGRLILADALAYATEQKPAAIFDAATLTGAIVVALGNIHTGLFTRDSKLVKRIQDSSDVSGELVWPMPLTDFHVDDMKGQYADLNNIGNQKGAGSATAAAFLEQFVDKDIPWAHFDIAGTAWNVSNRFPYNPKKGASGVMVRTFVALAESYF